MDAASLARIERINKINDADDWDLAILDESALPDVKAIESRHLEAAFMQHGKWRFIGGIIGVTVGIVMMIAGAGAGAGIGAGLLLTLVSALGIHLWVRSVGLTEAQRVIMPDIAQQCGGSWHESMDAVVPAGNPVSRGEWYRGHSNDYPHGSFGDGFHSSSFNDRPTTNFGSRYREEYGDGITGRLPGQHGLAYGIFNFTTIEETQTTDSEGKPDTDTDIDKYVVLWIDLSMPFEVLELKRRWMKGGGALGRLMDRIDTKVTSNQTLEMESEAFNRAFKVELPDGADDVAIRRMFGPKIMDQLVEGRIPVPENIVYRNGRIWIVDNRLDSFNARNAAKTLDYMLFRAQVATQACQTLADELGHDIVQPEPSQQAPQRTPAARQVVGEGSPSPAPAQIRPLNVPGDDIGPPPSLTRG